MKEFRPLLFSLLLPALLYTCNSAFAEKPPSLADLDVLTARWIALRGTLAEESRLWKSRKTAWDEEIELLEEESTALGRQLDATREGFTTSKERRADMLARRESTGDELERVNIVLDQASHDIRNLAALAPSSLRATLPTELLAFIEDGAIDLPRTQRAQRLVAFLSTLESMQNRFHVVRETLEVNGTRRQVDVIYLGLARGFAVSPANDWAAVGTPTAEKWSWIPGTVDPQQVRLALNVYNRQETATLASLPLAVEDAP